MSLRAKIVLVLSGFLLLFVGADFVLRQWAVGVEFDELEHESDLSTLERVREAVWLEYDELHGIALALASGLSQGEVATLLDETGVRAMDNLSLDLVNVCRADGEVAWQRVLEPESRGQITLKQVPRTALVSGHPLLSGMLTPRAVPPGGRGQRSPGGIYVCDRGLLFVSIARFRDGESDGHVLAVGRFLTPALVERLERFAGAAFSAWPADDPNVPEAERALLQELSAVEEPLFVQGDDRNSAYLVLEDLRKKPGLLLRSDQSHAIAASARKSLLDSNLTTVGAALLTLLVLLRMLDVLVTRPIARLTVHAESMSQTNETFDSLRFDRKDEIGRLSQEYDSMLRRLRVSQQELVGTARRAGMSEIASSALHNIGNQLNSVGVALDIAAKRVIDIPAGDLAASCNVLREHVDDLGTFLTESRQGKNFLPFLECLSEDIGKRCKDAVREFEHAAMGIESIILMIDSQQQYAGTVNAEQSSSLVAEVDAVLDLCALAFEEPVPIEIVRTYEDVPEIAVDRHKLSQVLVNLVMNATRAIEAVGRKEGLVQVRLFVHNEQRVAIAIQDDGCGIEDEDLLSIFAQGYSRFAGGTGAGLHAASNFAGELGGSLGVASPGRGLGATFTLYLPRSDEQSQAA